MLCAQRLAVCYTIDSEMVVLLDTVRLISIANLPEGEGSRRESKIHNAGR